MNEKMTDDMREAFFQEAGELSDEFADFLKEKNKSPSMTIFGCMTTIAGLAALEGIPKDMFVKLASDTIDRMQSAWDKVNDEAER